MKKGLVVFIFLVFFIVPFIMVRANIDDEINENKRLLDESSKKLQEQEVDYQKISAQLTTIRSRLIILEKEIKQKAEEVKQGEQVLGYQKNLLNERAKSYYKNVSKSSFSLLNLIVAENLSLSLENFFYQKALVDEDRKTIIKIVLYIKNLEVLKARLESEQVGLAALKIEADRQSKIVAEKINSIKQTIAALTARQQQLIAQKLASLNIPKSAGTSAPACIDDRDKDPGFSPRLAFYTYGVPNRVGLNQYGAYGRAKGGQSYETILRAYYNFDEIKNYDGVNINVEGYSSYSLEEYVHRIYEVPDSWGNDGGFEALKAQAIAARSYVLAYTNNGSGSICATDYCQVFKPDRKGGNWERAVNETSGKVMVKSGSPIKAWFSSTHGGYIFSSGEIGWSNTDWTKHGTDTSGGIGSFSDLQNNAYDKNSPWFYCDWGSRKEYNKTAWLKPQEVADIVNTILLVKRDSSIGEHLYQPDKPNPAGTDTWDAEKVKSELRSRGGSPYNSVSNVSVGVDFGAGRVASVNVSGDAGDTSFDAKEFKDWFNLRAPANIQIVGPLYNIEKK